MLSNENDKILIDIKINGAGFTPRLRLNINNKPRLNNKNTWPNIESEA